MAAPIVSHARRILLTRCNHYPRSSRNFHKGSTKWKGLVLSVYEGAEKDSLPSLGKAAEYFNKEIDGKFSEILSVAGRKLKCGKCCVLYGLSSEFDAVAVACLGKPGVQFDEDEQRYENRENVRTAIANGIRQLRDVGKTEIFVDHCKDPEAAAEGSFLSAFQYDELKSEDKRKPKINSHCYLKSVNSDREHVEDKWSRGRILAEAQNLSRKLMETPANKLTPQIFADVAKTYLCLPGIKIHIRDKAWIESEKMEAFLSVAKGSEEPPVFLEIDYMEGGSAEDIVALVGKGVTFDSGGISIKPSLNMDLMRGDMGGAACVVGALYAAAKLKIKRNIKAFIPLCENMPSSKAVKPGDVVTARNGKTIQVDNTDAEGRLLLADTLCYAETFKPKVILDMATLTGAIDVALGSAATGVFSNSSKMFDILQEAGKHTGDRVWRMPLFKQYSKQIEADLADVNNTGKTSRSAGACTAAAFLKEFVTNKNWLHLDIAGVMSNKSEVPYLGSGMSGRPTRTIIEFLERLDFS